MFRTCVIKNSKRATDNRIQDKSIAECAILRPDERTLPFFDVVPEQVLFNTRYLSLPEPQQGAFWRLIMHVVAPDRGLVVRHPGVIADRLGITKTEWPELEEALLNAGLLVATEDGNYLVQHELREQYLQTLEINNAKRRF